MFKNSYKKILTRSFYLSKFAKFGAQSACICHFHIVRTDSVTVKYNLIIQWLIVLHPCLLILLLRKKWFHLLQFPQINDARVHSNFSDTEAPRIPTIQGSRKSDSSFGYRLQHFRQRKMFLKNSRNWPFWRTKFKISRKNELIIKEKGLAYSMVEYVGP